MPLDKWLELSGLKVFNCKDKEMDISTPHLMTELLFLQLGH